MLARVREGLLDDAVAMARDRVGHVLVAVIALAAAVVLAALAHLGSIAFRGAEASWSIPTSVLAGFAL